MFFSCLSAFLTEKADYKNAERLTTIAPSRYQFSCQDFYYSFILNYKFYTHGTGHYREPHNSTY
jgi:hypothetical protein